MVENVIKEYIYLKMPSASESDDGRIVGVRLERGKRGASQGRVIGGALHLVARNFPRLISAH